LIKYIREKGWSILNGEMEGDKEGEWTYTGSRGKSVIDYVIINEKIREKIMTLEMGDQVDSDHHPVIIKLTGGKKKEKSKKGGRDRKTGGNRERWDEEEREWFKEEMERMEIREGNVQESINEVGTRIRETLGKMEEKKGERRKNRGRGWWDEECAEEKRRLGEC